MSHQLNKKKITKQNKIFAFFMNIGNKHKWVCGFGGGVVALMTINLISSHLRKGTKNVDRKYQLQQISKCQHVV